MNDIVNDAVEQHAKKVAWQHGEVTTDVFYRSSKDRSMSILQPTTQASKVTSSSSQQTPPKQTGGDKVS